MKLLILKAAYPQYLEQVYAKRPELLSLDYSSQKIFFDNDGSWAGGGNPWAIPMKALGYDVTEVVFNAEPLQKRWALENGCPDYGSEWMFPVILSQIRAFKPDILWIQDYRPFLPAEMVDGIRDRFPFIKLIMGWRGAPGQTATWQRTMRAYDVLLSCVPELVASFTDQGIRTEQLNHAFDQRILSRIDLSAPKNRDMCFVGQMYLGVGFHRQREELLRQLVARGCHFDIFSSEGKAYSLWERWGAWQGGHVNEIRRALKRVGGVQVLASHCPAFSRFLNTKHVPLSMLHPSLDAYFREPVFGVEMLQVFHDSRIVLNKHIDVASLRPSNIRLFEATGVGACLLTDAREGMQEFFEPGLEIVTYNSVEECLEKARWLLAHPQEREDIARRGQARCLREHTYDRRAPDLDRIIRKHLSRVGAAIRPSVIHVVIPTHNRSALLKRAVVSLQAQSYRFVKVHVVDCGSTDGTGDMLEKEFGGKDFLSVQRVSQDVWWTQAMALGVSHVLQECQENDFILSFNDDVVCADAEVLARLLASHKMFGKAIVIAGCRAYETKDFLSSGLRVDWERGAQVADVKFSDEPVSPGGAGVIAIDIFYGRGALIPVRVFREIGNYHAHDFPQYRGDAEFAWRAKEAGWQCLVDRKALLWTAYATSPASRSLSVRVSLWTALSAPFSRKSPRQIANGFRFIDHCCPAPYRWRNKISFLVELSGKVLKDIGFAMMPIPWKGASSPGFGESDAAFVTEERRSLPGSFWAMTAFFNPTAARNKVGVYRKFRQSLQEQGVSLLAVELAFGDEAFALTSRDADILIQLRGDSANVMWQKEALLNIGLKNLPVDCDKVAWLDCDIIFSDPQWASKTATLLEQYPVVQPFSWRVFLDRGEETVSSPELLPSGYEEERWHGVAYGVANFGREVLSRYPLHGHVGLAWAIRREVLDALGFFDRMIIGSGDLVIAHAFYGNSNPDVSRVLSTPELAADQASWAQRMYDFVQGRVFYADGYVFHLWHGDRKHRGYEARHKILGKAAFDPAKDIVKTQQGLWAWASQKPRLHDAVKAYFFRRNEEDRLLLTDRQGPLSQARAMLRVLRDETRPVVSVITPVLNRVKEIEACLKNVIAQGILLNVEHIICDRGSEDGTLAVINKYILKYPHIRLLSVPGASEGKAVNEGVRTARSRVVGILPLDELYGTGTLRSVSEKFGAALDNKFMLGNAKILGQNNNAVKLLKYANVNFQDVIFARALYPAHLSVRFYHKALHESLGYYDESMALAWDTDFVLKALRSLSVVYHDEGWGTQKEAVIQETQKSDILALREKIFDQYRSSQIPCFPQSLPGSLWGITAYFNPAGYRNRYRNYLKFRASSERQGLKLLTVELAFDDAPYELHQGDADLLVQIRGSRKNIYWQKEALLNIALGKLPPDCDKVAWVDCDILFQNDDWVADTARLLERYHVVQPFSWVIRLQDGVVETDSSGTRLGLKDGQKMYGMAYRMAQSFRARMGIWKRGHVGFVWAARRDIFKNAGFFDLHPLGRSDALMAEAFYGGTVETFMAGAVVEAYRKWFAEVFAEVKGSVFYAPGVILHLWHGDVNKRYYFDRHKWIKETGFDPLRDVRKDHLGMWEWVNEESDFAKKVREYFLLRQEDGEK